MFTPSHGRNTITQSRKHVLFNEKMRKKRPEGERDRDRERDRERKQTER